MSYGIHPFKDELVCDVSPLDVCDVVLGQPYMWRCHVFYESRPCSVIITLGGQLYRIPEVVSTTAPPKQCRKVISHTEKFILFIVCSKDAQKSATTTASSTPSIQQKHIFKEKEDIASSPTMVPTQYPIKPRDNKLVDHIQPRQQPVCDSLP
jgi:long-subunit acyl-CoA synthetase (AMP-forming)